MKQLSHRVQARRDLLETWFYTTATWSAEQADRYLTSLDAAIQSIAAGTSRGTAHSSGYLRLRVDSHLIFYRENSREVTIMRVLHERRDADRHLPR